MIRAFTVGALAAAALVASRETGRAAHCDGPSTGPVERDGVNAVNHTRPCTCWEARYVYRNQPSWRDDLPGNTVKTAGAFRIPSPAIAETELPEALHAPRYCTVWNLEQYRAPIIPFGNHVLWSVRMEQTFAYDGFRVVTVYPSRRTSGERTRPPTGSAGTPTERRGATTRRTPAWDDLKHTSDRWQKLTSTAIPSIGITHSTPYLWVSKQWNGDWAATARTGLANCGNAD